MNRPRPPKPESREPLRDCLCWRCMDCGTLLDDDADYYKCDVTGETICPECMAARVES